MWTQARLGDDTGLAVLAENGWRPRDDWPLTAGNYRVAEADLNRTLLLKADHVEALEHRGFALAAQGRHDEALQSYEAALKHNPSNVELLLRHGDSLLYLGRCAEAVAVTTVVALAPGNPDAWLNRGVALSRLGRHGEALESYDSALHVRPDFSGAWHNRGSALLALNDRSGALSSYDRAVAVRPDYFEAWKSRGVFLLLMKAYGNALNSFDRAVSLNRDDAEAWMQRGNVLSWLQRHEDALAS